MKFIHQICNRLLITLLAFFFLSTLTGFSEASENLNQGQEGSVSKQQKEQAKLEAISAANLMSGEIQPSAEGTLINVESGFVRLDRYGETVEAMLPLEMTFNEKVNTALEMLLDLKTGEMEPLATALTGASKALVQGNDRFLNVNIWGMEGGAAFLEFKERYDASGIRARNRKIFEVVTRFFIKKAENGEYSVNEVRFTGKLNDLSSAQLKVLWRAKNFGMVLTNGIAQFPENSPMLETMNGCFDNLLKLVKSKRELVGFIFKSDGNCTPFFKNQ